MMGPRELHERAAQLLSDLPPRSRVLDVPAGVGALTLRLADMGLQAEGGDLFPELFRAEELVCHQLDMNEEMPFAAESFDAIVSVEGIEHLENPFRFVRECNRLLKPGGRLLITTPNICGAGGRLRFFLTGFFRQNIKPLNEAAPYSASDHISLKTYPQLRHMLHTSGFQLTCVGSAIRRWRNAWFYLFYPLAYLYTAMAMHKEQEPEQRERNRQIKRQIFSRDLLLDKALIIVAERIGEPRQIQSGWTHES